MTKSLEILERSPVSTSVRPSLKYSCSGSWLILTKGSTTIEGLFGNGKAGGGNREDGMASAAAISNVLVDTGREDVVREAMNRYPRRGTVAIKRGVVAWSRNAWRISLIHIVNTPSVTTTSGQTACHNSSLVTNCPACSTK